MMNPATDPQQEDKVRIPPAGKAPAPVPPAILPAPQVAKVRFTALAELPPEDLRLILADTLAPTPILDFENLHKLSLKLSPEAPETKTEFQARLEKANSRELMLELEKLLAAESDPLVSKVSYCEYLNEIVQSEGFRTARSAVIELFKPKDSAPLSKQLVALFLSNDKQDSKERTRDIKALLSPEYRAYVGLLQTSYGLAPDKDLAGTLRLFHSPQCLEEIRSERGSRLSELAKEAGASLRDLVDLRALWIMGYGDLAPGRVESPDVSRAEKGFARAAKIADRLTAVYGDRAKFNGAFDFARATILSESAVSSLRKIAKADQRLKDLGRPQGAFANPEELLILGRIPDIDTKLPAAIDICERFGVAIQKFDKEQLGRSVELFGEATTIEQLAGPLTKKQEAFADLMRQKFSETLDSDIECSLFVSTAQAPEGFLETFELDGEVRKTFGIDDPPCFLTIAMEGKESTALLKALSVHKLPDVTLRSSGGVLDLPSEPEDLARLAKNLGDGTLGHLSESIRENWEVESIDFADLASIALNDVQRSFFLDPKNAQILTGILSSVGAIGEYSLATLARRGPEILAYANELKDPVAIRRVRLAFPPDQAEPSPYAADPLSALATRLSGDILKKGPEIDQAVKLLASDYALSPTEAQKFVLEQNDFRSYPVDQLMKDFSKPELKAAVAFARSYFKDFTVQWIEGPRPFENANLLEIAITLKERDLGAVEKMLNNAQRIGLLRPEQGTMLDYNLSQILRQENVFAALQEDGFVAFEQRIQQRFFKEHTELDVFHLSRIEQMFQIFKKHPEYALALENTESLATTKKLLSDEFHVQFNDPGSIQLLCHVSSNLDLGRFRTVLAAFRESEARPPLSTGDVVLLSEISKYEELFAKTIEGGKIRRDDLVASAKELYRSWPPPVARPDELREFDDRIAILKASEPQDELTSRLIRDFEEEKAVLETRSTGRPNPRLLSDTALVRLQLLDRFFSQGNAETMRQLGNVVARDIADEQTEYGGVIRLDGADPSLFAIHSYSHSNGEYSTFQNIYLPDGLTSFHLHALAPDNSDYSGPSGLREGDVADAGYVRNTGSTDVVITTLGHPKTNGVEDRSQLLVNIDMYYFDPRTQEIQLVDLGSRTIPFSEPAARSVR